MLPGDAVLSRLSGRDSLDGDGRSCECSIREALSSVTEGEGSLGNEVEGMEAVVILESSGAKVQSTPTFAQPRHGWSLSHCKE